MLTFTEFCKMKKKKLLPWQESAAAAFIYVMKGFGVVDDRKLTGKTFVGNLLCEWLNTVESFDRDPHMPEPSAISFSTLEVKTDLADKEPMAAPTDKEPLENMAAVHIAKTCDELKEFLLAKNKAYGNSAFDPIRFFSKASPLEQLNVRLDDKLSRIVRGDDAGEDTELDLLGYLVLRRALLRRNGKKKHS